MWGAENRGNTDNGAGNRLTVGITFVLRVLVMEGSAGATRSVQAVEAVGVVCAWGWMEGLRMAALQLIEHAAQVHAFGEGGVR